MGFNSIEKERQRYAQAHLPSRLTPASLYFSAFPPAGTFPVFPTKQKTAGRMPAKEGSRTTPLPPWQWAPKATTPLPPWQWAPKATPRLSRRGRGHPRPPHLSRCGHGHPRPYLLLLRLLGQRFLDFFLQQLLLSVQNFQEPLMLQEKTPEVLLWLWPSPSKNRERLYPGKQNWQASSHPRDPVTLKLSKAHGSSSGLQMMSPWPINWNMKCCTKPHLEKALPTTLGTTSLTDSFSWLSRILSYKYIVGLPILLWIKQSQRVLKTHLYFSYKFLQPGSR